MPPPAKLVKAWHPPFKLGEKPRLKVIRAEINVDQIRSLAKKYNVSITEYIISVYLNALQEIYISTKGKRHKQRVLRIEVPINLRNKFKSRTMRNFSLFILPEIDMRLGTYSFEEILLSVHHQLKLSSETKQISRFLSSNVSYEKLIFVRILPLFIKRLVIASIYRSFVSKRWSGLITNLGLVTLPEEMEELIEYFELIPPPPNKKLKVSSAIISYKNKLRITFCNITRSRELERHILKHLSDSGLHVKILNNK